ncbi:hypothetical protein M409DRAFT_16383 [Zasmidium cellare ATCC 36951]|uniref:Uncharacterized protein n=1 Tax=Zasmidium cellare ATCC 36951 TaxID=1080233 RepID=A0A6A6D735_ZASCE|nr:uncharacterized protein M409DRAFT_16383 [Zasmidium cellare ATCC 36951]KAF2174110.1 hypothetical protein M409DRAFT_16383 [Zasmidium cellare ATCC 36951]
MSSKLEKILTVTNNQDRQLQTRLSQKFDAPSLRVLRSTSRTLANFVHKYGRPAFLDIYIHAPVRENDTMRGIDNVGPFCKHLTITIAQPKQPTTNPPTPNPSVQSPNKKSKLRTNALRRISIVKKLWSSTSSLMTIPDSSSTSATPIPATPLQHPDAFAMDLRLWTSTLTHFPNLTHLTLRSPTADPTWPGRQLPEQTLLLLRLSLEKSHPKHLHTLTLSPLHALGLLHLRSTSFGSFHNLPPPPHPNNKNNNIWRNLTTLTLHLTNPVPALDPPKSSMFLAILHDYLRFFSPTLRHLTFLWLGPSPGPNPLALLETSSRPRILWPRLESFWFGNVTHPNKVTAMLRDVAPRCAVVKTLRSGLRFSRLGGRGDGEEESWYDVPRRRTLGRGSLAASSIYSQDVGGGREERVSRTSRVVPFMLDVKSQGEMLPATRYQG